MINVPLPALEYLAAVLAGASVTLPDGGCGKFRTLPGHLIVSGQDNDRGDSDELRTGAHRVVTLPDGKLNPSIPFDWNHLALADIQRRGDASGQHAKSFGRGFHMNSLPVPVQDKHSFLAENRVHNGSEVVN